MHKIGQPLRSFSVSIVFQYVHNMYIHNRRRVIAPGGKFILTLPTVHRFEDEDAFASGSVQSCCELLSFWRNDELTCKLATAVLDKIRPGAKDVYISEALSYEVPECMLSVGRIYNRVSISEATPVSSAISVEMPDVLSSQDGTVKKPYDPAMLLRGCVGLGRLLCLLARGPSGSVSVKLQVRKTFTLPRFSTLPSNELEHITSVCLDKFLSGIKDELMPEELERLCEKSAKAKMSEAERRIAKDALQQEAAQGYLSAGMGTWDEPLPRVAPQDLDTTSHEGSFQELYNKALTQQSRGSDWHERAKRALRFKQDQRFAANEPRAHTAFIERLILEEPTIDNLADEFSMPMTLDDFDDALQREIAGATTSAVEIAKKRWDSELASVSSLTMLLSRRYKSKLMTSSDVRKNFDLPQLRWAALVLADHPERGVAVLAASL